MPHCPLCGSDLEPTPEERLKMRVNHLEEQNDALFQALWESRGWYIHGGNHDRNEG